MSLHKIIQPAKHMMHTKHCTSILDWRPDFGRDYTARFDAAQRYVDSEILRRNSPRVPFRDGYLEHSGTLLTEIGSGVVCYGGPYASHLYRHPEYNFDTSKHADARGEWFEHTKIAEKDDVLRGAKKIVGAK